MSKSEWKTILCAKYDMGNTSPHELQNSVSVLKSVSKDRTKNKDGKRKNKVIRNQSNRSNQFVGFRLISLTKRLMEKVF